MLELFELHADAFILVHLLYSTLLLNFVSCVAVFRTYVQNNAAIHIAGSSLLYQGIWNVLEALLIAINCQHITALLVSLELDYSTQIRMQKT